MAYKVQFPTWWSEQFGTEPIYGTTDGVETCCCSAERCYLVTEIDSGDEEPYSGYFAVRDLTILETID